jgi:hypothetical protein
VWVVTDMMDEEALNKLQEAWDNSKRRERHWVWLGRAKRDRWEDGVRVLQIQGALSEDFLLLCDNEAVLNTQGVVSTRKSDAGHTNGC